MRQLFPGPSVMASFIGAGGDQSMMLRFLLVTNALLQWMDATSTVALLWVGGAEGNPLMARLIEEAGIGGFLLLKLVLALGILVFLPWVQRVGRRDAQRMARAAGTLAVAMVFVVAWNVHIVLQA